MSVEPCPEDTGQAQRQKLWFFPVDNTRAQRDPTIRSLMRTIEKVTRNEEYIKKKVGCYSSPLDTPSFSSCRQAGGCFRGLCVWLCYLVLFVGLSSVLIMMTWIVCGDGVI